MQRNQKLCDDPYLFSPERNYLHFFVTFTFVSNERMKKFRKYLAFLELVMRQRVNKAVGKDVKRFRGSLPMGLREAEERTGRGWYTMCT